MFSKDFTPSSSDPPSPTLTAVDLPDTLTDISGSQTPTTRNSNGMTKVHPADLEAGISNMDKNDFRNNSIKEEKYHDECIAPSMHSALQEVKVSIVEVNEGNIYISSNVDDPDNPRNWPKWKRYLVAGIASWLTIIVCSIASGYSTGAVYLNEEFGLSEEVGTLGLSLYVASLLSSRVRVS
ncbi:hypothetical protein QFC22_005444 [Naganishia vaughanmartiniae]|uniref:Uncharacterized protein n=1 Tax=Naganishia vaughanmartiniae TaxID=1424756 RepID=A0ACC2WVF9_9TREE|nr:hypothetical protein QFC22_005444 [Naganishia vaughanmartiniae]